MDLKKKQQKNKRIKFPTEALFRSISEKIRKFLSFKSWAFAWKTTQKFYNYSMKSCRKMFKISRLEKSKIFLERTLKFLMNKQENMSLKIPRKQLECWGWSKKFAGKNNKISRFEILIRIKLRSFLEKLKFLSLRSRRIGRITTFWENLKMTEFKEKEMLGQTLTFWD